MTNPDLVVFAEACSKLRISKNTLKKLMENKEIGYYKKIGGRWMFSVSRHIEPFLESREIRMAGAK